MSVRSIALANLRGRVIHGIVLGGYVATATQAAGTPQLVAGGAIALGGLGSLLSFASEVSVLRAVARDDGDALLTTGERLNISLLDRAQRLSQLETTLLALAAVPVAGAVVATAGNIIAASVAFFAVFLGLFELFLVLATRQNGTSRDAFVALRERRPNDAIALLQGQDLRPAARWNDALLLGEAWVMVGAVDRALQVIRPHLGQQAVAIRDAAWRLEADPSVARAFLAQAPHATRLERVRRDEVEVLLLVREGRGAEAFARLPEYAATFPDLPPEYADVLRLGLAAAANQAGHADGARDLLAGLTRPLVWYASQRHVWPSVWRWIDPEGVVPVPPALARAEAPVGDVFAPPRVDPPVRGLLGVQMEGVQPVPSLPVGAHRSYVRRAFSALGTLASLTLVAPVLLMTPALWLLGSEPELARLTLTLGLVVAALVTLGLADVYRFWLRSRPPTGEEPNVVYHDGSTGPLVAFRRLGAPALVERALFVAVLGLGALALFGFAGMLLSPVLALVWNSQRPFRRGRALTLAVHDGDDGRAAALCTRWLGAWVVAPKVRAAVEVHLALALARQGDAAGARAAVAHTDGIAEARWCRAWLTADALDARALEGVLVDDSFGWWRTSAVAVSALGAGRPVDGPALEGLAARLRSRFGDVLWVLLAMDQGRERGRALLAAKGVEVTRFAWLAAVWPALAPKFAALV